MIGNVNMTYDPNRHHRRSIRLRGYDYAQAGTYFVTVCTQDRQDLFADPVLRSIAEEQWRALDHAGARSSRPNRVSVDTWVVMPDHVHGIIVIGDSGDADDVIGAHDVGAQQPDRHSYDNGLVAAAPLQRIGDVPLQRIGDAPLHQIDPAAHEPGINVAPGSLGAIIRSYKAAVARRMNHQRRMVGARVWQRGYWEHIIRDDASLDRLRRYILENPVRWNGAAAKSRRAVGAYASEGVSQ